MGLHRAGGKVEHIPLLDGQGVQITLAEKEEMEVIDLHFLERHILVAVDKVLVLIVMEMVVVMVLQMLGMEMEERKRHGVVL